jgi:phage terminase large subunit
MVKVKQLFQANWKNKYKLINFSVSSNLTSVTLKQNVMKLSIYEDCNMAEVQQFNHRAQGTLVSRKIHTVQAIFCMH